MIWVIIDQRRAQAYAHCFETEQLALDWYRKFWEIGIDRPKLIPYHRAQGAA